MSLLPKKYRQYLGLGAEIAASIAIPLFLGYFADSYFGTSPWLTLAGIVAGITLFIIDVIHISNRLRSKDE